ncbi:MAG: hypothetical protein OQK67_05355 [Chlorobium sp.]|nr:hypothetical protein [Chlorobium sp.]MCW8815382.1 hypothetical protein [Chlorobium sp.]MCW8819952.1 hypothetical protein [Ignavibacteriaceae bacterium]
MQNKAVDEIVFNFDAIVVQRADPEALAVNLARQFYQQMRKQDFDQKQVLRVASELVGCLTANLEEYRKKILNQKE